MALIYFVTSSTASWSCHVASKVRCHPRPRWMKRAFGISTRAYLAVSRPVTPRINWH